MEGNKYFRDGPSKTLQRWVRTARMGYRELRREGGCLGVLVTCTDQPAHSGSGTSVFGNAPGDLLEVDGSKLGTADGVDDLRQVEHAVNDVGMKLVVVIGETERGALDGAFKAAGDRELAELRTLLGDNPYRDMLRRSYRGTLKHISEKHGYGLVSCPEVQALWGRDVYLPRKLLPEGAQVGERVSFILGLTRKGRPKAIKAFDFGEAQAGSEKAGEGAEEAAASRVFERVERLLKSSPLLRAKVRSHAVEVHGAVFEKETGRVIFLGMHPQQSLLVGKPSLRP